VHALAPRGDGAQGVARPVRDHGGAGEGSDASSVASGGGAPGAARMTRWQMGVLLVVSALALTIQEYLAPRAFYEWFVYDKTRLALQTWTFWSVVGYVVL